MKFLFSAAEPSKTEIRVRRRGEHGPGDGGRGAPGEIPNVDKRLGARHCRDLRLDPGHEDPVRDQTADRGLYPDRPGRHDGARAVGREQQDDLREQPV